MLAAKLAFLASMLKEAIIYVRVAELIMAKGTGDGVTLTDWGLAYLANN